VWDYTTDFRHYFLPFPNHRILAENIRFFVRNNVKGIFEEDTYNTPRGELSELDGYLLAKFLWNPQYDENRAINEFLDAYYGKAAGPIRQYIDLLGDRAVRENIHVNIGTGPDSPHVADDLLLRADGLWQQAEAQTAGEPDVLRRVKLSRMSVDYALVERARLEAARKLPRNGELHERASKRLAPFLDALKAGGVTRLNEWKTLNLDDYRQQLAGDLGLHAGEPERILNRVKDAVTRHR